jgi:hypothetical protein
MSNVFNLSTSFKVAPAVSDRTSSYGAAGLQPFVGRSGLGLKIGLRALSGPSPGQLTDAASPRLHKAPAKCHICTRITDVWRDQQ